MKRRIVAFPAASALMLVTAAPALAAGPPTLPKDDDPAQGCENSPVFEDGYCAE